MIRYNNIDGFDVICDFCPAGHQQRVSIPANSSKQAGETAVRMGWANIYLKEQHHNACPSCSAMFNAKSG